VLPLLLYLLGRIGLLDTRHWSAYHLFRVQPALCGLDPDRFFEDIPIHSMKADDFGWLEAYSGCLQHHGARSRLTVSLRPRIFCFSFVERVLLAVNSTADRIKNIAVASSWGAESH